MSHTGRKSPARESRGPRPRGDAPTPSAARTRAGRGSTGLRCAVALLLLAACRSAPARSGDEPVAIRFVGPATPALRARADACARVYGRWLGVEQDGLVVELVGDPEEALPYDSFDQSTNRIAMTVTGDPEYDTWTLAHELGHAYHWAFDPVAYDDEPSWIHEGLAEYLVYLELQARDPSAAKDFLAHAAQETRTRGLPFERVFSDVYQAGWERTYPVAMLAVYVLAHEPDGKAKLLRYLRAHGPAHPARALRLAFGFGPRELARRVERIRAGF